MFDSRQPILAVRPPTSMSLDMLTTSNAQPCLEAATRRSAHQQRVSHSLSAHTHTQRDSSLHWPRSRRQHQHHHQDHHQQCISSKRPPSAPSLCHSPHPSRGSKHRHTHTCDELRALPRTSTHSSRVASTLRLSLQRRTEAECYPMCRLAQCKG